MRWTMETDHNFSSSSGQGPGQPRASNQKERALHVLVPEDAHCQARIAAVASRMTFKAFMARLMSEAKPLPPGSVPSKATDVNITNNNTSSRPGGRS